MCDLSGVWLTCTVYSDQTCVVWAFTNYFVSGFLDATPVSIAPTTSLNRILHLFKALGVRTLLVCRYSILEGIITRKDLQSFLDGVEGGQMADNMLGLEELQDSSHGYENLLQQAAGLPEVRIIHQGSLQA